ncbi:MAG: hypothetical protein F9K37_08310, partial [Bacteroidales bacterium]
MIRKVLLILVIVALSIIAVDLFTGTSGVNTSNKEPEVIETPAPILEYGIPVDSFNIVEGQIRWGQTIGNLLSGLN